MNWTTMGASICTRFRPDYKIFARPIETYPAKSQQAAAIMLMIQNNLDDAVGPTPTTNLLPMAVMGVFFQTGRSIV
jgi:hypothetical protein